MTIAVDFDGTCVTHEFPKIGKDIGAVPVLKALVKAKHKLILHTMRSDMIGNKVESPGFPDIKLDNYLTFAMNWFKDNGIKLWHVQTNPIQSTWTESPKCYADLYIDDAALGCPLKFDTNLSSKPFVDWEKVNIILKDRGIL